MTKLLIIVLCFCATNAGFPNELPEFPYMDLSADPCDDFYQFTCGNFANVFTSPSVNVLDEFALLQDELVALGRTILSSCHNDPVLRKAKKAYRACLQSTNDDNPELATIKDVGGMPLVESSNSSITFTWTEIGDLVANYGVPLLFSLTVGQINQNQSVVRIGSDTLSNPSLFTQKLEPSYEELLEEEFKTFAGASAAPFDIFLQTIAGKLLQNSSKSSEEVVGEINDMANFMRKLYSGGIIEPGIQSLESEVTLGQLQAWTDRQFASRARINWKEYLRRVFQKSASTIDDHTLVFHGGVNTIFGVLKLVQETDPKIVKNFALLRIFLFQAPDSDQTSRQAFDDYYKAIGVKTYPREEYCARKILDVVDSAGFSYALAHVYQNKKLDKARDVVTNIHNILKETLSTLTWMDEQSRAAALQKAENMLVFLGFPDFVRNATSLDFFYANLPVSKSNYENARHLRAFKQAYQLSQLSQPARDFWGKSPFDSNAYYNRPNNKIVIPIALLNPGLKGINNFNPIFFYGDNDVLDYSRLGSIIGHEMTHGFDVRGKDYDQDGILQSWWSSTTEDCYNSKTGCFIDQYSQYYVPEVDTFVNGSYSLNENLADNGGIKLAYKAFKKFASPNIGDQQFFVGYGTMWCSFESNKALQMILATPDGYPPKRYRVLGSLSNMPEFAEAFNCPLGSPMNPSRKCSLW